jgi:dipeptidyl aminopeptidase/acylaminoacyl peptidase
MRHPIHAVLALAFTAAAAAAQPAVLAPGDNLVVRGIPPVPATIPQAIAPYAEFRQAATMSWRGSARELLICTRFGDAYQFHLVEMPGGARRQLTFLPDGLARTQPADGIAAFDPSGRAFVFVRDTGSGRERNQLFLYDLASRDITLLTDGQSRNDVPIWSRDGGLIAYTSTQRNGGDRDVWVLNPRKPAEARLLAEVQGHWEVLDWSPDGRTLLAGQYVSSSESRLWLIDLADGQRRELRLSESPSLTGLAQFGRHASEVFATNDANSEFQRLVRVDARNGRVTPLASAPRGDVEALSVSSDGTLVAYVANEEGVGTLHVYDADEGRDRPLSGLPPGSVLSALWRPGSRELAFDVVSSRHPRDAFSIDVGSGRVARWTTNEMNGLKGQELADAELVRWKSFDGLTITGFIYRPPKRFEGRRPVMINLHGGPAQQERPRFLGFSNYFIDELGVALVYPNVRGSTGFGKSFLTADDGLNREAPVKDVGALLDWIASQPDLDPSRVMVTGASFGGYMTYAVATSYPDRIRCAFAGFAISSLVTDLEHTAPEGLAQRRAEYGDERVEEVRKFLQEIAPLTRASRLNKPLFIAHGRNDRRVPLQEAEQMAAAVEKSGAPLWFLVANDEGHGFGRKTNADFLFAAWAMFVQEYLIK